MAQSAGRRYRGHAVIIANESFSSQGHERPGASKDGSMMEELFTDLDFKVQLLTNITSEQICDNLTQAARQWPYDYKPECFVCVISSHGEEIQLDEKKDKGGSNFTTVWEPVFLGSDSIQVRVNDVLSCFAENNCNLYKGKPKLFFIQACRTKYGQPNKRYDTGVYINVELNKAPKCKLSTEGIYDNKEQSDVHVQSDSKHDATDDDGFERGPIEMTSVECPKNCLVMFPVTSGRSALRDKNSGSLMLSYMHRLSQQLVQNGMLMPFLTSVSMKMSQRDCKVESPTTESSEVIITKCSTVIIHRLTTCVELHPMSDTSRMAVKRREFMKMN